MFWRLLFNGTGDLQNANSNVTPMTWDDYCNSEPDLFWTLHDYERCRKEAQETKALGHTELVETVKTLTGVVTRLETELTETKTQHEEKLRELEMVNRNQNEMILRHEEYQLEQQNVITTQMREINQMKESWREEHDINRSQNEAMIQRWYSLQQEVQDGMHVQAGAICQQECRLSKLEEIVEVQKSLISEQELRLHRQNKELRDKIRAFNQHQNTQRELESTVQRPTLKLQQLESSLSELGEVRTNQKQSLSEVKSDIPAQDQRFTQHESTLLKPDDKVIPQTEKISPLEKIINSGDCYSRAQKEFTEALNNISRSKTDNMLQKEELYKLKEYNKQQKEINRSLENMAAADGCTVSTHTQDTDCSQDGLGHQRKYSNTQTDMINQQEIPPRKIKKESLIKTILKTMRQSKRNLLHQDKEQG